MYNTNIPCKTPTLVNDLRLTPDLSLAMQFARNKQNPGRDRIAKMHDVERALVKIGTCKEMDKEIMNDLRVNLFEVDGDKLEKVLSLNSTTNSSGHRNIACMVDAVIYNENSENFSQNMNERLKYWFDLIKVIGKPSIEGYAMKTKFLGNDDIIITKSPRDSNGDDIVHEAFIGFYVTNKIRRYVPNFMYVYGYVDCSRVASDNKTIVGWCANTKEPVSYLFTEYIKDHVTMEDFFNSNAALTDIVSVLYQLLNALALANTLYKYTHYDLHNQNVLVRKFASPVTIPFYDENLSVIGYFYTQYVPYIIDYGHSRAEIGNVLFDNLKLEISHGKDTIYLPMHDTYRHIMFLAFSIYRRDGVAKIPQNVTDNKPAVIFLSHMYSFFNEGMTLSQRAYKRIVQRNDFFEYTGSPNITQHNMLAHMNTFLRANNMALPYRLDIPENQMTNPDKQTKYCDFIKTFKSNRQLNAIDYCEIIQAFNENNDMRTEVKNRNIAILNDKYKISVNDTKIRELVDSGNTFYTKAKLKKIRSDNDMMLDARVREYNDAIVNLVKLNETKLKLLSYMKGYMCAAKYQNKVRETTPVVDRVEVILNVWTKLIQEQKDIMIYNMTRLIGYDWNRVSSYVNDFWVTYHADYYYSI